MNKSMLIALNEGLLQIVNGIQVVQNVITLAVEEGTDVNVDIVKSVEKAVKPVVEAVEDEEVEETVEGKFTKADLDAMSYNDIKKLAKECEVSAKGSKDAIIERILAVDVEVEAPTADEIAEAEVEETTEEVDENAEVVEEDDIQAMVERETADMTLEEIAEVLSEVGKSTKGKRQSLIARLVEAVEEGLIAFGDDDDEESEEEEEIAEASTPEEVEEEEEETLEDELEELYSQMDRDEAKSLLKALGGKILKKDTVDSLLEKVREYDQDNILAKLTELGFLEEEEEEVEAEQEEEVEEVSEENYFDESNMTATRKQAIKEKKAEVLAEIKSGAITIKDIDKVLADFYLPHEGYEKSLPKQEKIDMFVEAYLRLLDDEGEENEFESPYYINEQPACCGHFLKDADGALFCEVCGTEYDSEEE